MSVKGFRRILFGEKMPGKNSPEYKECYERDVGTGRHFVKTTRIDKIMAKVQGFAGTHRTLFLVIVFGFAICGLTWNIYRLAVVYHHHPIRRTATEMQDSVLRERHKMLSVPHIRRFDTKESDTERPEQNGRLMNMPFERTISKYAQLNQRGTMNNIFKRTSSRQPKYMLPAILYIPLLGTSYFVFDLFHTEKTEVQDKTLQTTEFLNPELPDAQVKSSDGIGSKYEDMARSWDKIRGYSAVNNIERDGPNNNQEEYESQYTEEDIALLDRQEKGKDLTAEVANAKRRKQEALTRPEEVPAETRLRGQRGVMPSETDGTATTAPPSMMTQARGTIDEESRSVKVPAETGRASEVMKKVKTTSDYFGTLVKDARRPELVKAIIDESIKAVDDSRVWLRLLDDIEIDEDVVRRGTYPYATVSGFSSGHIKGSINNILAEDELVKISLSIYDTDGLEELCVPISQFHETSKDVASNVMSDGMNMNTSGYGSSLAQWDIQVVNNTYQKASDAVSKAIKKNRVKLKYGTFMYLVNGRKNRN